MVIQIENVSIAPEYDVFKTREFIAARGFASRFPCDPAARNLRNWARFEADNPDTFIGMYQFRVQKIEPNPSKT